MDIKTYNKTVEYLSTPDKKGPIVYVLQEIPGTREGRPKINIVGASKYGELVFLLPELSQIIFSPGPLVFRRLFVINWRSCNNRCCMFYSF